MSEAEGALRLDKWLFHARFFKTRALAMARIEGGGIRINGQPCRKPGRAVRAGDRLTISAHARVRVVQVLDVSDRRGPPSEAQALYRDIDDGLIDRTEMSR